MAIRAGLKLARGRGVMIRPSGCSSTVAPSLRSSVARAAIRSVSLWRMWPTLRIRVRPSAKSAVDGQRHHGVADGVHVHVHGPQRSAGHGGPSGSRCTVQPMCSRMSTNARSPCKLDSPSPSTVTVPPVIAARAKK